MPPKQSPVINTGPTANASRALYGGLAGPIQRGARGGLPFKPVPGAGVSYTRPDRHISLRLGFSPHRRIKRKKTIIGEI
jgi:hypothetical protein